MLFTLRNGKGDIVAVIIEAKMDSSRRNAVAQVILCSCLYAYSAYHHKVHIAIKLPKLKYYYYYYKIYYLKYYILRIFFLNKKIYSLALITAYLTFFSVNPLQHARSFTSMDVLSVFQVQSLLNLDKA